MQVLKQKWEEKSLPAGEARPGPKIGEDRVVLSTYTFFISSVYSVPVERIFPVRRSVTKVETVWLRASTSSGLY